MIIKAVMAVVLGIIILLLAVYFIINGFIQIPGFLFHNMTENSTSIFPGL